MAYRWKIDAGVASGVIGCLELQHVMTVGDIDGLYRAFMAAVPTDTTPKLHHAAVHGPGSVLPVDPDVSGARFLATSAGGTCHHQAALFAGLCTHLGADAQVVLMRGSTHRPVDLHSAVVVTGTSGERHLFETSFHTGAGVPVRDRSYGSDRWTESSLVADAMSWRWQLTSPRSGRRLNYKVLCWDADADDVMMAVHVASAFSGLASPMVSAASRDGGVCVDFGAPGRERRWGRAGLELSPLSSGVALRWWSQRWVHDLVDVGVLDACHRPANDDVATSPDNVPSPVQEPSTPVSPPGPLGM